MSVLKGLAFFFFVMVPGFVLFAYVLGGGMWVVFSAVAIAGTWALTHIGVSRDDVDVVAGTLAVVFFVFLCAVALRSDTSNRL